MIASQRGAALVLTLMITTLVAGLGAALLLVTSLESAVESNHEQAHGARQAADAGLACAVAGLRTTSDWAAALAGAAVAPPCLAPAPAWAAAQVDEMALTAQLQAAEDARYGMGPDTPRWRLWLSGTAPGSAAPPAFLVLAWIADDREDDDGDPLRDGNGVLQVRVTVVGRRSGRAAVDALIQRDPAGAGDVRLIGWRVVR